MRKAKEINDVIKILEKDILRDAHVNSDTIIGHELFVDAEDELRGARKALIWAMKTVKKKKIEEPSKKLEEFGIKNPR